MSPYPPIAAWALMMVKRLLESERKRMEAESKARSESLKREMAELQLEHNRRQGWNWS